ncbi:hypothetical protein [uncultured Tateyamaria sp.]|uniref:hypothetical protein n=1 Tax=uncultured Tateyamaria sp. TaxID=455651 RepID=UPI0026256C36|nr:hypothetical protein [uncultured Tateyamaria sp.]
MIRAAIDIAKSDNWFMKLLLFIVVTLPFNLVPTVWNLWYGVEYAKEIGCTTNCADRLTFLIGYLFLFAGGAAWIAGIWMLCSTYRQYRTTGETIELFK